MQNSCFLAVGCGLNDRYCLASDFIVLVLSEAVLRETVLVLDGGFVSLPSGLPGGGVTCSYGAFVHRLGFRRARAQSAAADGARSRNRFDLVSQFGSLVCKLPQTA